MAKRMKYVRPTFTYGPVRSRWSSHNRFRIIPPWDTNDPDNWPKIRTTRRGIIGMLLFWILWCLFSFVLFFMMYFQANLNPKEHETTLIGLAAALILLTIFPVLGIRKAIYDLKILSRQEQKDRNP